MEYNKKSYLSGIVDALNKKHDAENKLKAEIIKSRLQSQMRQEEQQARTGAQEERDKVTNPQRYTPEQQYLRRRYLEENPLAQMALPAEGDDASQGILMPSSQVTQDPKTKQLGVQRAAGPDGLEVQNRNMEAKVAQMRANGQEPNKMILKLLDLQRQELAKRKQKEGKQADPRKRLKDISDYLDGMEGPQEGTDEFVKLNEERKSIQDQIINGGNGEGDIIGDNPEEGDLTNSSDGEAPDWIPDGFDYAAASQHYSDDELKQLLGV